MSKAYKRGAKTFKSRRLAPHSSKQRKAISSKPNFFGLFFVVLILVFLSSLAGLLYFGWRNINSNEREVKFWLYQNPEQVFGQSKKFIVFVENKEADDLKEAEIILNFPAGFILEQAQPECDQTLTHGCQWQFEKIKKGSTKEIELQGKLYNTPDQSQDFQGSLTFELDGFSSVFQEELKSEINLQPSLKLNWQMPEQSSAGDDCQAVLLLENISKEPINNIKILIDKPSYFTVLTSDPILQEENNYYFWFLDHLKSGQKKILEFNGKLGYTSDTVAVFKIQIGLLEEQELFIQLERQKTISLKGFNFQVNIQAKSSDETETIVEIGELIPIQLSFNNQLEQSIRDLKIKLAINNSHLIDLDRLNQEVSQTVISNNDQIVFLADILQKTGAYQHLLTWDHQNVSEMSEIYAQQKGKISFNLPLKNLLVEGNQSKVVLQTLIYGRMENEQIKLGEDRIILIIDSDINSDISNSSLIEETEN